MTIESLTLTEYVTRAGVPLDSEQRDLLAKLAPSIGVRPTVGFDGLYDLTPGSEIGSVELPGLSIQIAPKLPIDRVLFLVSYAVGGFALEAESTQFEKRGDVLEAIVAGFTAQVRRAVRPGLLQGYRQEEEGLSTIRGRIRFEAQIRERLGVAPPIEVRYDDFTVDIEENRIIKAAITRVGRMRLRSARSRRELRGLQAALNTVSTVEFGSRLPEFTWTRLNDRYRQAVRLAELILRSTSFDLGQGDVSASSFLVDMNQVFEDFVVLALRDSLHLNKRELTQGGHRQRLRLDVAGRIPLKPDISWWVGKRCVFVGDVKYKKTQDHRVPNADLYQLLAYTTVTDLPGGLLIYAAGEDEPGVHEVRVAGKALHVVALDLAGSPDELLAGIDGVGCLVRSLGPTQALAS